MDAIQAARELGKAIQTDERYIKISIAQQNNDGDEGLQKMIAEFNRQRTELNQEAQKGQNRDQEKIGKMDAELKETYRQIFANENMIRYSSAKTEFETLLAYVNQIISGSANGQNPDAIEYQEGCGGDCGGCAGCS